MSEQSIIGVTYFYQIEMTDNINALPSSLSVRALDVILS